MTRPAYSTTCLADDGSTSIKHTGSRRSSLVSVDWRRQDALVDVVLQAIRRREDATQREHGLDPVIDGVRQLRLIQVFEPDRATVEHRQCVVADCTRAKA